MCSALVAFFNFVTVILSIISAIYWIASSSINIVEKDEFIILEGGNAEDLNNALSQEKKENLRNKYALNCLWDILKICISRLIYDCNMAHKNRSLGILFHYNEIVYHFSLSDYTSYC